MRYVMPLGLALLAIGFSACGDARVSEQQHDPAPQSSASARVESLRRQFGALSIRPSTALSFETLASGHVHPITPAIPTGLLTRKARVELPAQGDGLVLVEDEATRVAVRFAQTDAPKAKLELANGLAVYGTVVHRPSEQGTEDFVHFAERPRVERLTYRVDVQRAPGLRLVENTLEFLDDSGTPRLRVDSPYVLDAKGVRHEAQLTVEGCAYDRNPDGPWRRPIVAPGAKSCLVHVSWSGVEYPALVDPSWVSTGSMRDGRYEHTAIRLPSGSVLIIPRNTGLTKVDLFSAGTFAATGSLPSALYDHADALLPSGKVLVTGGRASLAGSVLATAYTYSAGVFTKLTPTLVAPRRDHVAITLKSGKVLIAGGNGNSGGLTTAELYDETTNTFTATGSMSATCDNPRGALDPVSGKVLITGDYSSAPQIFDGVSTFSWGASLGCPRRRPAVVGLAEGGVMVAGDDCDGTAQPPERSVRIFLSTVTTTPANMNAGRARFSLVQLASGRILAVGGRDGSRTPTGLGSAEEYLRSGSDTISSLGGRFEHTATLLSDNTVLVAGGMSDDTTAALSSALILTKPGLGGDRCTVNADCGTSICDPSGYCPAGSSGCTATCTQAAAGTGSCVAVKNADDPNSCTGINTCDAAGVCKLKNGQPATVATNCASGIIADGVCCDTACGGVCDSCVNAGKVGTCSVAAGYPGSPSCTPYLCQSAVTCPTTCTTDANCVSTHYCNGGACVPKKAPSGTCDTGARECANGLCVDGFCCNTACTGNCYACSAALTGVAGSNGTCTLVANGQRGRGECGPTSCSAASTVSAPVCNGSGSCTTKSISCGSFACTGGACATACSKDTDCGSGAFCAGTTCAPQAGPGTTCSKDSMCLSGHCVDGVCCSSACTGACEACNEGSSKGTCVPVTGDPRASHPACNGAGTACAGTCDGVNRAVCSYPSVGVACGSGCSGSSLSVCSATGTCLAPAACPGNFACASTTACKTNCAVDGDCASTAYCTSSGCAPKLPNGTVCTADNQCTNGNCVSGVCCATACTAYACLADGSACRTGCSTNDDCNGGSYCSSGSCVARKAAGATCSAASECSTGNCVDGVCCDRPCTGTCEACTATKSGVAGSTGTCSFIVDGRDPDAECGTPTCTGSVLNANVCNGTGVCRASVTDCGSAKCVVSGTSGVCENTCTTDVDCGGSGFCNAGKCAPKVDRAATCAKDVECKSGFCADGVCCNEACTGQCQACGEPGSVGTCLAVKGKPRTPRTDCVGSGSACYGQCDGTNLAACAYPTAGKSCGGGCTDGKAQVCDGAGVCLEPTACAGNFACDGTSCKNSCAVDTDCAAGFTCSGNKCVPSAAARCSDDGTQSIPSGDAGAPQTCAPYRCLSTGACGTECSTTNDCAAGFTCDSGSKQCVAGAAPPTEDGGGCSTSTTPASGGTAVLFVGLLFAFAARRRRDGRND